MIGAGSTGSGRPVRRLPASTPCRSARTATGPGKPTAASHPLRLICRDFTYSTAIWPSHAAGGGPVVAKVGMLRALLVQDRPSRRAGPEYSSPLGLGPALPGNTSTSTKGRDGSDGTEHW